MRVAVFSTKPYDRRFFEAANARYGHRITFLEPRLTAATAPLAEGHDAVCPFVHDDVGADVVHGLADRGVRLIALRCAGYNHVALDAAEARGLTVVRVPAYSPHAVAEHTLALILSLNRRIHRAYNRVREANFAIDGLLGFDLNGKTAGVVGTGRIGGLVAGLLRSFGCEVLAYDIARNPECERRGVRYVSLDELLPACDLVTLHCPLTPETHHLISADGVGRMKDGAMLINTSRGALIDAPAVIDGLKSGKLGSVALDVYEEEGDVFFEDLSNKVLQDDVLARLLTFPNVLITSHQAFFTQEAMENIAETTLTNVSGFDHDGPEPANTLVQPA